MGTVTLVFVVVTGVITCSFMELGCFVSYTQAANHFRKCGKTSLWMVWSGNCDPGHHEVFKSLSFFLYSSYSPVNKHLFIYIYIDRYGKPVVSPGKLSTFLVGFPDRFVKLLEGWYFWVGGWFWNTFQDLILKHVLYPLFMFTRVLRSFSARAIHSRSWI